MIKELTWKVENEWAGVWMFVGCQNMVRARPVCGLWHVLFSLIWNHGLPCFCPAMPSPVPVHFIYCFQKFGRLCVSVMPLYLDCSWRSENRLLPSLAFPAPSTCKCSVEMLWGRLTGLLIDVIKFWKHVTCLFQSWDWKWKFLAFAVLVEKLGPCLLQGEQGNAYSGYPATRIHRLQNHRLLWHVEAWFLLVPLFHSAPLLICIMVSIPPLLHPTSLP